MPNVPNSAKGGWADVGIVTGLLATDGQKAAQGTGLSGRLRVIRWDNCEEYTTTPGPTTSSKVTKMLPAL